MINNAEVCLIKYRGIEMKEYCNMCDKPTLGKYKFDEREERYCYYHWQNHWL